MVHHGRSGGSALLALWTWNPVLPHDASRPRVCQARAREEFEPMTVLAAAVQMSASSDKRRNLECAERLIRKAAAEGARLVVLPEVFNWRGRKAAQPQAAEELEGATLRAMALVARELELFLVAGAITERIANDATAYNTSPLLDPEGAMLGRYRKIHLFDVELAGRVTARDSDATAPGAEVTCVPTTVGTSGLSVCYDLRVAELYMR